MDGRVLLHSCCLALDAGGIWLKYHVQLRANVNVDGRRLLNPGWDRREYNICASLTLPMSVAIYSFVSSPLLISSSVYRYDS